MIEPDLAVTSRDGVVARRGRLGGLLNVVRRASPRSAGSLASSLIGPTLCSSQRRSMHS